VSDTYDAVVIGGGPAGSTAALLLARAGWSVAVVERTPFPRRKVCGEFLSASNMPLLRVLGVAGAFLDLAGPEVTRVGLFARNVSVTASMPRLHEGPHGWGRALGREHLDTLLLDQAATEGARIFQPWTVKRIQQNPDDPDNGPSLVHIASAATGAEQALGGRLVIAAHGSWDPGHLPTQPARTRARRSDLFGFKAHFRNCQLPRGLMPLLAFPGGYGGMVHTDHGRVSVSCCVRRDQLEKCRLRYGAASAGDAVLEHITSSCSPARSVLEGATMEGEWRGAGPIRPGIRLTSQQGIFLAGNAAGEAHPVVAEGISMAMQSGYALAHALITSPDVRAARRNYAHEWRRTFSRRIHAAAAVAHWAMHPAAVAFALPLLQTFPAVLTEGARTSGKVTPICSPSF
jgi:flavin-dependent dehydrogenase